MSDMSEDDSTVLEPTTDSKHFSEYEVNSLIELVNEKKSIVESKKTDFGTKDNKNKAWIKIAEAFNSDEKVKKRTFKQLKKKWENLKTRAKKDISKHSRERKKTGGGPEPESIPSTSEKVQAIVPSQMVGLENPFDCDSDFLQPDESQIEIQRKESTNAKSSEAPEKSILDSVSHTNSNSGQKIPNIKKDPRSALTTWEFEEHQVRMKTLLITQEIEKERLHQTKLRTQQDAEESDLRKELIRAQIAQFPPPTSVVIESVD